MREEEHNWTCKPAREANEDSWRVACDFEPKDIDLFDWWSSHWKDSLWVRRKETKKVRSRKIHTCHHPQTHPLITTSSSIPYTFMCCKPKPSLNLFPTSFFNQPLCFSLGVCHNLASTWSGNSWTREQIKEAHEGEGDASRVDLRASVKIVRRKEGREDRADRRWEIWQGQESWECQHSCSQLLLHESSSELSRDQQLLWAHSLSS